MFLKTLEISPKERQTLMKSPKKTMRKVLSPSFTNKEVEVPVSPKKSTMNPALLKKLRMDSRRDLNTEVEALQKDLLIQLRVYDDKIWQRLNTKTIKTITKNDEIIVVLFEPNKKKMVFSGIGNMTKHNKKHNVQVKIKPLQGKETLSRDFKFVHNYEPCKKQCTLDLKLSSIQDLMPVVSSESADEKGIKNVLETLEMNKTKARKDGDQKRVTKLQKQIEKRQKDLKKAMEKRYKQERKKNEATTNFFPFVFSYKKDDDFFIVHIYHEF